MMTFEVPGPPVSKQRPRRAPGGHWYTPQKTIDYEEAVAWSAKAAGVKLAPGTRYNLEIDLHLSSFFRDRDNVIKAIQDGLQRMGDGWDDRLVWGLIVRTISVRDASEEKAVVRISSLGKEQS